VAQRHIHLSPEEARDRKVTDGQVVSLQTFTQRPVIFRDVVVRVHPQFRAAVHLDYDEANACGFRDGDLGRILS
jgi:propanediol utilization protein